MRTPLALAAVLAAALLSSCTIIDLRVQPDRSVRSDAFITGFASVGWPADDSLLKVGLFDGPNRGSMLYAQLWKLLRVDIGFVGAAVGVGPLDLGLGLLLHKPRPPRYVDWLDDCDDWCCDDDCDDWCCDDDCDDWCCDDAVDEAMRSDAHAPEDAYAAGALAAR